MTTRVGRTVRLSALAIATGTVIVAASTGASASPAATPKLSFAGNTGSSVVSLDLDLPGASTLATTLAAVPELGGLIGSNGDISLSLLNQTGSLQHDATGKVADLADSQSTFAGGSLGSVLTNLSVGGLILNQQVVSTLQHPVGTSSPALGVITNNLPASLSGLLGLQVPGLKVTSATSPIATAGNSVLAGVSLGKVSDALPAGTLTTLTTTLNSLVSTLTGASSTATGTLGSTLSTAVAEIVTLGKADPTGKITALGATLTKDLADVTTLTNEIVAELPGIISSIENGSIVSLNGLTTTHSVTMVGGHQVSTVSNKLAGISILGGLINLDGFANSLTTEAGGTAGTSKVIAQPNLAKVSVGTNNELTAVLGELSSVSGTVAQLVSDTTNGITGITGVTLGNLTTAANTLTSGVTTLTGALNSVLSVAGVQIKQDAVTEDSVAPDGTSAKGALAGLQIIVNPLAGLPTGALPLATKGQAVAAPDATTPPLLDISVGALNANSAAAVVAPTVTTITTTPTTPAKRLAFTGADLPVTAGIASLLVIGGAYAARRRRSGPARDDI